MYDNNFPEIWQNGNGTREGNGMRESGEAVQPTNETVNHSTGSYPGGSTNSVTGGYTGGTPNSATGSYPGGTTNSATGSYTGGTPNSTTGSYTGGTTNSTTGSYTGGTANNATGNYTGGTTHSEAYRYGNTYPNDYASVKRKEEKTPKKSGGGSFKKAIGCAALGLLFGLFMGIGLYFVQYIGKLDEQTFSKNKDNITADSEDTADMIFGTGDENDTAEADSDSVILDQDMAVPQKEHEITTVVTDVTNVVKEVMPAIVTINNKFTEQYRYFGQTVTNEAESSGSGIIIGENDTELLIATNYHVIENGEEISVNFVEGSEALASVKGTDADMDLAVIAVPKDSIDASTRNEITIATLGDSDALVVGEPAIAIGNALGYGQSVTTGVISALNRTLDMSNGVKGTFIQTDAAINPGNSGGALLNIQGEVVGINSNKIGGSAVEGMGYAIPISAASPIISDLMLKETKSKVDEENRGYLGISGITVSEEVSSVYGMPEGVYIAQVYDDTPAAATGLKKGDIIVKFGDEDIASMDDLQKELQFHAKGETVEVIIMTPSSGGFEEKTVEITLGDKVSD